MSELLTTGQMVDRLKVGEVAVGDVIELGTEIKVFKDKIGHIKSDDSRRLLELSAGIVGSVKWRIIPNYVSFEEAMQALKEGKPVTYHGREGDSYLSVSILKTPIQQLYLGSYSLEDLLLDKWSIEED